MLLGGLLLLLGLLLLIMLLIMLLLWLLIMLLRLLGLLSGLLLMLLSGLLRLLLLGLLLLGLLSMLSGLLGLLRQQGKIGSRRYIKMTEHKERFEEKVCPEPNTGCHLWTAAIMSSGYGAFGLNGKTVLSHRVAYELYVGPIPEGDGYHGTCVRHTCDNPLCVNPAHLEVGTHQDNMDDKVERDRAARHTGESNGLAKLTEADVLDIRARYAAGGVTQRELAEEYGVNQSLVSYIKNKHIWSHIHD